MDSPVPKRQTFGATFRSRVSSASPLALIYLDFFAIFIFRLLFLLGRLYSIFWLPLFFNVLSFSPCRVQRVSRLWRETSWQSRFQLDFGEWTTQPELESLLDCVERCNPAVMRKIVFMDVSDINTRLKILDTLSHLQSLSVSTCNALGADGMRIIGAATSLCNLEMHRCGKEVPDHTTALRGLYQLTRLDMGLIGRIDNDSLEFLTALTRMKNLEISRCRRVSSPGLVFLSSLHDLRALDMTSCSTLDSSALQHLSGLENLESLRIARCNRITDQGLFHLTNLTNLRHLDMRSVRITNAGMSIFTALTNLETIDLKRCVHVSDDGVRQMSKLVQLRSLTLAKCSDITGSGLGSLVNLTNLVELDLTTCKFFDADMHVLEFFSKLQRLKVSDCTNFKGDCLKWVNSDTLLELHLELCVGIKDEGFSHLSRFTNLATLNVNSNYLGRDRLHHLGRLTALENLMAQASMEITDASISSLCSLVRLKFLDLGYCGSLSNAGIVRLTQLTNLRTLYLTQCNQIDWRGISSLKNITVTQ